MDNHYKRLKVEPLEICKELNFIDGNILKYLSRHPYKNGVEDLNKALFYMKLSKNQRLKKVPFYSIVDKFCKDNQFSNDLREILLTYFQNAVTSAITKLEKYIADYGLQSN